MLYISLWSRLIFIYYTFFVSRIMSIYIYDSALDFPLCLSCALYFYLATFFIFVTKRGRSIKHTCKVNQIPMVEFIRRYKIFLEVWEISLDKKFIFLFIIYYLLFILMGVLTFRGKYYFGEIFKKNYFQILFLFIFNSWGKVIDILDETNPKTLEKTKSTRPNQLLIACLRSLREIPNIDVSWKIFLCDLSISLELH